MAYAVAAELRARYRQGIAGIDELANRTDADLNQALVAASAEIDRWRPAGELGADASAVLRDVCLILGRMLAHQDEALGEDHPIVRDAIAARAWLRALAAGSVRLPVDEVAADGSGGASAAPVRVMVYDDAWSARYML
jgi:phage gp36-like protein